MRAVFKAALTTLIRPVLRMLSPSVENIRRLGSHLTLSSRLKYPLSASVVVMGDVEVRGTGNIRCGQNLLLYPALYWETADEGSIDVGDDVVMSRGVHVVAHASVRIGAGSMIGEYSSIRDANHVRDSRGVMRDGDHSALPIKIGNRVWIGRGSIVLPGVTIGDNATVGANSVVSRDVPAGVTVVGAPAAPIRSSRIRALATKGSRSAE